MASLPHRRRGDLSERQAAFVRHFALYGKATEAARAAGYGEGHAKVRASRLLATEKIREAVRMRLRLEATEHIGKMAWERVVDWCRLGGMEREAR